MAARKKVFMKARAKGPPSFIVGVLIILSANEAISNVVYISPAVRIISGG